jgi:hypothetical protein
VRYLFIIFLFPLSVRAEWTSGDTLRQAAYTGLRGVVAKQTVACMKLPACYETGVLATAIYGNRPTANEIYKFNALIALGAWALNYYAFDSHDREFAQWAFIGVGLYDVYHNHQERLPTDWWPLGVSMGVGLGIQWTFR